MTIRNEDSKPWQIKKWLGENINIPFLVLLAVISIVSYLFYIIPMDVSEFFVIVFSVLIIVALLFAEDSSSSPTINGFVIILTAAISLATILVLGDTPKLSQSKTIEMDDYITSMKYNKEDHIIDIKLKQPFEEKIVVRFDDSKYYRLFNANKKDFIFKSTKKCENTYLSSKIDCVIHFEVSHKLIVDPIETIKMDKSVFPFILELEQKGK